MLQSNGRFQVAGKLQWALRDGVIADLAFDLPWTANPRLAATGAIIGTLAALVAGLFATRGVVNTPPSVTLRELQG